MSNVNQFDPYREMGNNIPLFRKKTEQINWKKLAALDIDKIIQQNDVQALRDNIKHVAFCDVESDADLRDNNKTLVKMFKLTQLMVDYLLSSQDCLAGALNSAEERGQMLIEEADAAKRKLQENEAFIADLKRECHRRKKLILAQQQIMDSGPNAYHRCPYCEKAFLNGTFLQAHLEKRHADRYIKDWQLLIDASAQRKRSPKRSEGTDDRNLELLLQKLLEQRTSSPPSHRRHHDDDLRRMAGEFDRERDEWHNTMRQLQNEIEELHDRLDRANTKNKKQRSHLQKFEDDPTGLTREEAEKAIQKALEEHNKKPKIIQENVVPDKRPKKPTKKPESERRIQSAGTTQTNVPEPDQYRQQKSVSPRHTTSSPVRRNNIDKELQSNRDSMNRSSDNFDYMAMDYSPDLLEKFCDEVRHTLDDHLELHGIKRGTIGISGAIFQDKMKLMNHEQSQMKAKYLNYAESRKKLEAEVDQEARNRLRNVHEKPQPQQQSKSAYGIRSPDRAKPQLSARSLQSSQSEWDDESQRKPATLRPAGSSPIRTINRLPSDEREEFNRTVRNRSPIDSPDHKGNLHQSSDMSNTLGSSAWKTDSKAVTSVHHPGSNLHKPSTTNRSSDFNDESEFST